MRTNEILHKPGEEGKLWNADRLTHDLAGIIMTNVNGTARRSMVEVDSPDYEALLNKQIEKVVQMLKNDINHIRESDHAFAGFGYASESKEITETTSEQYEVMLDLAGELGDKIAADNILDDHTNAWSQGLERLSPEEITVNVDKHLATASKRMNDVAHRYIRRRFRKD